MNINIAPLFTFPTPIAYAIRRVVLSLWHHRPKPQSGNVAGPPSCPDTSGLLGGFPYPAPVFVNNYQILKNNGP